MRDTYSFELAGTTRAPIERAFEAVADPAQWERWARPVVRRAVLSRAGHPERFGAGAVRAMGPLRHGPAPIRERILEYSRNESIVYSQEPPVPFRTNHGEIHFRKKTCGTEIRWTCRFAELIPGSGPVLRYLLAKFVGFLHGRLIEYLDAEHPACTEAVS
ncbi:SRPBCC family protein [Sciscionella sediminilitoris]|uniref:SRPBCC family protein n=1 Tax=Sciscionella sediminilitoris TaxID=1445613 RepID=UPI0004DF8599|nr:SRPBCC family protein [Sciscionella sp. SE31]